MKAYMEFLGTNIKLPDAEKLRQMALIYLREGGEDEEADLLARCGLEVGGVKFMVDNKYAIDITLRCCRVLVVKLRSGEDGAEEPVARRRLRQAVRDSLPGGFCIATFEARAGLNPGITLVAESNAKASDKGVPAEAIKLGRMSYLPGFARIWLAGEEYDLRERKKARLCIQYLVEQEAFTEGSACHFDQQINPYVREHSRLDPLPEQAETKIHHYFNPSRGKLAELGRKLLQSAGHGTGCYFLNIR